MYTNNDVYLPLLEVFGKATRDIYEAGYPHGIFVPYTFDGYMKSSRKVFYVGQDTHYWMDNCKDQPDSQGNHWFIKHFDENNLSGYLDLNQSMVTPERLFEWNNNGGAGTFWDAVQKIHLSITFGGEYTKSLKMMRDVEKEAIRCIGYGNMNAIELSSSLKEENAWPVADMKAYKRIRRESIELASITKLIEAYSPDFIFIFNWKEYKKSFYGLKLQCYNSLYVDETEKKMSALKILGTNTKIIWTAHPSWLMKKGYTTNDIVSLVYKTFLSLTVQS